MLAQSALYETEPVGVAPEHAAKPFLNAVVIVESDAAPARLARMLHEIENETGRIRTNDRNAPRALDVDLLYAGPETIRSRELNLPHPRWAERRFVVQPLAEVRPNLVLPGEPRTAAEVLSSLPPEPKVVLFRQNW